MQFWFQSIRARLTFWYTLLVLLTLVAFGVASYLFTSKTLSENLDLSLKNEIRWVKEFLQPKASKVKPSKRSIEAQLRKNAKMLPGPADTTALADNGVEEADEIWNLIFKHTLMSPKTMYVQVADKKGTVIYRTYSLGEDSLSAPDTLGLATTDLTTRYISGEKVRIAVARDRNFAILVGYPLDELTAVLENLYSLFLILIPIAVLVSVFGGLYLAHKALKPVNQVIRHAHRITAENLDQSIPQRRVKDEIGRLIDTFNDMIGRLHDSFAQVRQFSSDASHELRTPLTILRGEIELALHGTKTPEAYRQVLESSLEEILRMSSIIENLLMLAKADHGAYEAKLEEVNLASLVSELFDDSEILAEPKHIRVELKKNEPITLVGDKVRLRQLFLNLVDNAIKYTPEGGTVSMAVDRQNGTALFEVHDTGIGIPQQEIGRIFDRFYRVDKARSREMGGNGLGLSIAKWIAELHRGTITVESEVNKGSTFTVHLPIH